MSVRATIADPDGLVVELTEERWRHITQGHPELIGLDRTVLAAVENPDRALSGRRATSAGTTREQIGPAPG